MVGAEPPIIIIIIIRRKHGSSNTHSGEHTTTGLEHVYRHKLFWSSQEIRSERVHKTARRAFIALDRTETWCRSGNAACRGGDFSQGLRVLGVRGWATRARAHPAILHTQKHTPRLRSSGLLTHLAFISIVHTPAIRLWLPMNSITPAEFSWHLSKTLI